MIIEHVNQTIMAFFFMMKQRFKIKIISITFHILTWKV